MSRLLDKLLAVARRDLLTAIRYRTAFLFGVAAMAFQLLSFYFLARAIGPEYRPDGMAYFPFLLVGTAFYTLLVTGVSSFVDTVQNAQMTGTMEVLMTTATPAPTLVLLTAASEFAGRTLHMVGYLLGGLFLFGVQLEQPNLPAFAVIVLLSLAVAVAIGLMAAAVQVAVHKGSALVWLLSSSTWLLTGTMFPVSSLPESLQKLAAIIPVTHTLDGMRMTLLHGAGFAELQPIISTLAISAVVLVPISLAGFSFALARARRSGTLSFY